MQAEIANLPPAVPGNLNWLIIAAIGNKPNVHHCTQSLVEKTHTVDIHFFHFDAHDDNDPNYLAYAQKQWYADAAPRIKLRKFKKTSQQE